MGAPEWIMATVTAGLVALTVILHFEVIATLNRWVMRRGIPVDPNHHHRPTLLVVIFALLAVHVAEIWLFGLAFWALAHSEGMLLFHGNETLNLWDSVYFSAATYTTVGYGDLWVTGPARLLAGTEALVGFMMITWSASFTYLVMARTWGTNRF